MGKTEMKPLKSMREGEKTAKHTYSWFVNTFNSSLAEPTWLMIRWNFSKRKGTHKIEITITITITIPMIHIE